MKLKGITAGTAVKDILTGIIIALVSIPISMGYAQVSGLSAEYGLYGSIFPILIFGLLSTSPHFIFGVDAAPAALVGAYLASVGIESGSDEAVEKVPMITLMVGLWLMVLYLCKAGRLVTYISDPVMGGFISGISTTIIFMQIPKVLGGTSGIGEIAELIKHIVITCRDDFNGVSMLLGAVSVAVLLISKKLFPKLPMSVFVMAGGALIGYTGFAGSHGVALLSEIERGLPKWKLPDTDLSDLTGLLSTSLTIAVVIMAETLLASNSFANRNNYKINNDREILVYSLGNLAAGAVGCCPVNGSVSRTTMGEQYGGKTQLVSLTASAAMAFILLFFTGFIGYLPVPVLTAIVISALLGAVEFHLIKRLYRQDKRELFIFFGAFFGVLIFGTVFGVVIGVVLSFVSVIINTANPKRSFLGVIPGHEGFHSLERNTYAMPLKNAVIYRFSGNLYFANINIFISDIENSVSEDTRCVVVDSGAVCSIDITAADRIASLERSLGRSGVKLYFASHIGSLNDRFRELGLGRMIEEGKCRRTIPAALFDAGIAPPYDISGDNTVTRQSGDPWRPEFEWAFGTVTDEELERYTEKLMEKLHPGTDTGTQLDSLINAGGMWKGISELDQEELIEHFIAHLHELSEKLGIDETALEEAIESRKLSIARKVMERDPNAFSAILEHSRRYEEGIRQNDPELYERLLEHRRSALEHLRRTDPDYSGLIESFYGNNELQ